MKAITKIALGVLATSIALLIILPGNAPGGASAPQSADQAAPDAGAAAKASAAPVAASAADPAALASETLGFLDGALEDLRRGVQAQDAQGISDEIEWPAIRLIGRWQEIPSAERQPFAACFDALDAMRILAGDITGADSLARRASIEAGAAAVDRSLSACRAVSELRHTSRG